MTTNQKGVDLTPSSPMMVITTLRKQLVPVKQTQNRCIVKDWFTSENAVEAPYNDLQFIASIAAHKKTDRDLSESVIKKISGNLWSLSDEAVGFALFDDKVPDLCKEKMAQRILSTKKAFPKLKKCTLKPKQNLFKMELADFVTGHTMDFLIRFKINSDFLATNPSEWKKNSSYIMAQKELCEIRSINDSAERGVKLADDFKNIITTEEKEKQKLLQVVCKNRKEYPTAEKSLLAKSM